MAFDSHHPVQRKREVVNSLADRAKNIPFSSDERSKEMKHITLALMGNGNPKRFIIDGSKQKRSPQRSWTTAPNAVNKGINRTDQGILSNDDIKVGLKLYQTIGSFYFLSGKTLSEKIKTRGAIYSIPCQDCGKSEIDERGRKFASRLKEHMSSEIWL